jgi:hypothetical protein
MTPDELRAATAPTEDEVRRVSADPSWIAAARDATVPDAGAVRRLLARPRPARPRAPWALGLAGVAVAAALAAVLLRPAPPPPVEAIDTPVLAEGAVVVLFAPEAAFVTPDVEVTGDATLRVTDLVDDGATVDLLAGHARFEVDPAGARRHLMVTARDVTVTVTGTRFSVDVTGPAVRVVVERGSVRVDGAHGSVALGAGDSWVQPVAPATDEPAAPEPKRLAPTAPPEAPVAAAPVDGSAAEAARAWSAVLDHRDAGAAPADLLPEVEAFLVTHPGGPLGEEAALLRLELLVGTSSPEIVLQAVNAWIADGPRPAAEARGRLIRAFLLHERQGDCVAALPDYAWAMEAGSPDVAARARVGLQACVAGLSP